MENFQSRLRSSGIKKNKLIATLFVLKIPDLT